VRLDAGPGARPVRGFRHIAIATYLGRSDVFDQAIAEFAAAYADQNERDYHALADAAGSGRVTAQRTSEAPRFRLPGPQSHSEACACIFGRFIPICVE
jgi:hypothetical protein